MPKRVPLNTIVVHRNGKNVVPPIGKPFDFTQQELDDIMAVMPNAVRKIINEAPDESDEPKVKPTGRRARGQADVDKPEAPGAEDAAANKGEGDL